jgi:hypothetical protein
MPFPASLTLVTVNVRADLLPDGGSAGSVRLHYDGVPLTGPTADSIVAYVDETETFAADGTATLQVPATNATGWTPQDFAYRVTLRSGSRVRRGTVQLDRATTTVNLADLIQWDGAAVAGTTYATLAQLNTVSTDLDAAEADIATLETTAATLTTGLKNSATALNFVGYVDLTTQPTTGTWAVGDVVLTKLGLLRCTEAGEPGKWLFLGNDRALENGYTGWTYDPAAAVQGSFTPTSGLAYVIRFRAMSNVISTINLHVNNSGGTNLTHAYATLHNDAGAVLGPGAKSANVATSFQSGGEKAVALAVGQAVTVGAYYRAKFWITNSGGTQPTLSRACSSSAAIVNPGQPAGPAAASTPMGYASAESGLGDISGAADNIGNITGITAAPWLAAKA